MKGWRGAAKPAVCDRVRGAVVFFGLCHACGAVGKDGPVGGTSTSSALRQQYRRVTIYSLGVGGEISRESVATKCFRCSKGVPDSSVVHTPEYMIGQNAKRIRLVALPAAYDWTKPLRLDAFFLFSNVCFCNDKVRRARNWHNRHPACFLPIAWAVSVSVEASWRCDDQEDTSSNQKIEKVSPWSDTTVV